MFLPAIVQQQAAFTFTGAFGMMPASVPGETPAVVGGCFVARGCSVRRMRSVSSLRRDVDFAGVFVAVNTERTHTLLGFLLPSGQEKCVPYWGFRCRPDWKKRRFCYGFC